MEGLTFIVLFLGGLFYNSQAASPSFAGEVSGDVFLFPGKSVKVTQTTILTEASPLKFKFKVPFNTTAYMRILDVRVKKLNSSQIQFTGSKTPIYNSSAGNPDIIDFVTLDFGQVTPVGTQKIVITFWVQLLDHPELTNGEEKWISLGAEFINGSIWANQQLVWCAKKIDPQTELTGSSNVVEKDDVLIGGTTVNIRLHLTHNPLKTTATANKVNITLLHPACLVYKSMTPASKSVAVQLKAQSPTSKLLAVTGPLMFYHKVEVTFTFDIDPGKTKPKGQIIIAFVVFKVSYSYPSPYHGSDRRGNMKRAPRTKVQFYNKHDSCDAALGMVSGTILDSMIRVSSHKAADAANKGRLNSAKAWIPSLSGGNQYIEVDFQGIKEIRRIALKGNGTGKTGSFVKGFRIFYSLDCAEWKPYRTKNNKVLLKGNTRPDKLVMVPLDPPIKAKCIRINPRSSRNGIALELELYGCASSVTPPTSNLKGRTLLVEKTLGYIYACSVPMISTRAQSCCYFSKDNGAAWTPIDYNVLNINFINPATKYIYGMGRRNTHFKCPAEPKGRCDLIPLTEYTTAKTASGLTEAKPINQITITDVASSKFPLDADSFTLANSKKVGGSADGVYYFDSSWTQKLSWDFLG